MGRINHEQMRELLKLYFIMGSVNCHKTPEETLSAAIDGGITLFQYREKGKGKLEGNHKLELGRRLQWLCKENGVPFIVNDDVELAIELDADGVHIGQEDASAVEVREKIGSKILGVSAHTFEEAKLAIEHGADYIGVGPMFPTSSKEDAREAGGPAMIKEMRDKGIDIPIVAIGGISLGNIQPIMEAGADGISIISAIAGSEAPSKSAHQLYKEVLQG